MSDTGKEDLRVIRTKEAIRKTFEEMICEMDYEQISIKELAERARINRKTFYLHYNSLDDLLRELQNEMAKDFIRRTQGLERPRDISRRITNEIMSETWGADGKQKNVDPYVQNIMMTFVAQSTIEIYKQWVADGKKIPLEEIIALTAKLICTGVNGLASE